MPFKLRLTSYCICRGISQPFPQDFTLFFFFFKLQHLTLGVMLYEACVCVPFSLPAAVKLESAQAQAFRPDQSLIQH